MNEEYFDILDENGNLTGEKKLRSEVHRDGAKGQCFWTTRRGTKKEKVLYWLYVYKGCFNVTVWFKEKIELRC